MGAKRVGGLSFLLLISGMLMLPGCADDPEPEPVEVLSLNVDGSYRLNKDTWIFVHNAEGGLIDYKQVSAAGVLTFAGSAIGDGDRVSVTIFNYDSTELNRTRGFVTYASIPHHTPLTLAAVSPVTGPTPGTPLGTVAVTYTLPGGTTMDVIGNGFDLGTFWRPSPDVKASEVQLYEKTNNVVLSIVADGNARYTFLENAEPGAVYNISFDTMTEFDKVLALELPSPAVNPFMQVVAYDTDGFNRYYLYNNTFNIAPYAPSATYSSVRLGSLNRFADYFVTLQIPQPQYFYTYNKAGAMPDALSLPDHAPFTLTEKSFMTFAYTGEIDFTMRTSHFQLKNTPPGDNTYWQFNAPPGSDRIFQLPDDFLARHPSVVIDNFTHVSSSFEICSDSYLARVDGLLKGTSGRSDRFESTVYGSIY